MTLNKTISIEERWKLIKFETHIEQMKSRIISLKKNTAYEIETLTLSIKECEDQLNFYKKYGHSRNGFSLLDYNHNKE